MPSIGEVKTEIRNGKKHTGVYTSSGWKWDSGVSVPSSPAYGNTGPKPKMPKGLKNTGTKVGNAAKAIVDAVNSKGVKDAAKSGTRVVTMTGKDGTKINVTERRKADGTWGQVMGSGRRVGSTAPKSGGGQGSAASAPSPGGSRSAGGGGAAPPKRSAAPPKPGKAYTKTRALYKNEKDNAPRRYVTDEDRKAMKDKSKFDMDMSASDVKAKRKLYLDTHPAAAKAVANGTMSMGDINLMVRRLSKRGFDWNKLKKK